MKLKRVLGNTTNGRKSFVCNPNSGNLIYVAGCVVVIFDHETKAQDHLYTESKQTITTIAITEDGTYLASANCGNQALIHIWDLSNKTLFAELISYSKEIPCMSFSLDGRVLVSAGYDQEENSISIWDWKTKTRISSHKLSTVIRAISFAFDGSYFVTVGDAQVKYWYLQSNYVQSLESLSISGSRTAILGEQKKNSFCDVQCGRGAMSFSTFCITKTGLLCEIDNRRLLLHKWVDLRTTCANSLSVSESLIVIGCSNGVIRCFNTTELRFLKNLPRPHSFGIDISNTCAKSKSSLTNGTTNPNNNALYPNVVSIKLNDTLNTVSCVYSDRSIYIWDLSDSTQIIKRYSALYHNSCIWGIDMYPILRSSSSNSPHLRNGSFITCSSDGTIRIWNPTVFSSKLKHYKKRKRTGCSDENLISREGSYLDESLKIIYTDASNKFLCDSDSCSDKTRADDDYDSNEGLRCLRISPDGSQLAVGSRSGAIRIFDFGLDKEIKNIAAHDAEVLCLEYSDPNKYNGFCYLASSSRDKLIHIFNAADEYNFLQTIDDHLSSITALRFVNNRARDCLQLVSCGADCRIIFRNGVKINGSGQLNFIPDQHIEGKNTFYDMEVDSESSCLMTACQDRMIRLFNVAQVKYQSGFKGSLTDEGTLIKIALDPSCTFLATSSTDKSINLYDYQRGERIGSVVQGLSDLVTDLKFSPDSRYLITCTGDGCIFIWKSPPEVVNAIRSEMGQLSLSSCSLGSFDDNYQSCGNHDENEGQKLLNPSKPTPSSRKQQSLSDWAKQQTLANELERSSLYGLKQNSDGSTFYSQSRKLSLNESLHTEPDVSGHLVRYQVQNVANHLIYNNNNNEHEYAMVRSPNLSHNFTQPSSVADDANSSSSAGSKIISSRMADNDKAKLSKDHSVAKLYQSRENLEMISSREKFVVDNLVHTNQILNKKVGKIKSSFSGLFNTKYTSNSSENQGIYTTIGDECEDVSNGIYAELQGGGEESSNEDEKQKQPSSALTSNKRFVKRNPDAGCAKDSSNIKGNRQHSAQFYHNNQLKSVHDRRLSQSMHMLDELTIRNDHRDSSDDELSSGEDCKGYSISSSANRQYPGSFMKTSGRRTNITNVHSLELEAIGAGGCSAVSKMGLGDIQNKNIGRKLNQARSLRSSKSEYNILGSDSQLERQQEQQHLNEGGNSESAALIYCPKVDLNMIDPSESNISKDFCHYVVNELLAISRYATRLHQTLLTSGDQSLCDLLSRGVQNSMDILSIVSPRAATRQRYYQSQLNLGPAAIAPRRRLDNEENSLQMPISLASPTRSQLDKLYLSQSNLNNQTNLEERSKLKVAHGSKAPQVKASTTAPPMSKSSNLLNLDQMLEAYSDRLFKMVQNRRVERHNLVDNQTESSAVDDEIVAK